MSQLSAVGSGLAVLEHNPGGRGRSQHEGPQHSQQQTNRAAALLG
ncbi:MAG: hypothetical protein ACKO8I_08530 [Cyanobacteriota bacterium]